MTESMNMTSYDQQRVDLRSMRHFINFETATAQFRKTIQEFDNCRNREASHEFYFGKAHDWEEVFAIVIDAIKAHEKANSTGLPGVMKLVVPKTEAFESFTSLLPHGSSGSVLCGGLKIIFRAAHRVEGERLKILRLLQDFPIIVYTARGVLQQFSHDPHLRKIAADIYLSTLQAMDEMIRWLINGGTSTTLKRLANATICSSKSGNVIHAFITDIEKDMNALKARVDYISRQILLDLTKDLQILKNSGTTIQYQNTNIEKNLFHMRQQIHQEILEAEEHRRRMDFQLRNLNLQSTLLARKLETQVELPIEQEYILSFFAVNARKADQDCSAVNRAVEYSEDQTLRAKAEWMLDNVYFQRWYASRESGAILLNDTDDLRNNYGEEVTAPSYVSAVVRNCLAQYRTVVPLIFFCTLHTSQYDEYRGPLGMMKCITAQLLLSQARDRFNFSLVNREHLELIDMSNLPALCEFFTWLVMQLPLGFRLFCLIDGVSMLDNDMWRDEAVKILDYLKWLCSVPSQATFKLMITNWDNLRHELHVSIQNYSRTEVIDVPQELSEIVHDDDQFAPGAIIYSDDRMYDLPDGVGDWKIKASNDELE